MHLEIQRNKEEKIFNDLNYKLEYMKENHPELNIIAIFLQGSQNYGLDDENSDIDTKAFCIPSLTSLIEGKKMVSKIYVLPDNSHIEVKDIRLLPELLRKQNPSYLEILSTDYYLLSNEKSGQEFMNILGKYKKYIFKRNFRLVQSIKGTFYAEKEQIHKRRPGNEEMFDKYGCDVKSLSHMYRMVYLLGGIREGKSIDELFMIPENFKGKNFRKELMDVKRGKNTETALKFVGEATHLMEVMYQDVKLTYENDNPNCATYPKLGDIDSSVFENLRKDINDFVKQTVINNIKKTKKKVGANSNDYPNIFSEHGISRTTWNL